MAAVGRGRPDGSLRRRTSPAACGHTYAKRTTSYRDRRRAQASAVDSGAGTDAVHSGSALRARSRLCTAAQSGMRFAPIRGRRDAETADVEPLHRRGGMARQDWPCWSAGPCALPAEPEASGAAHLSDSLKVSDRSVARSHLVRSAGMRGARRSKRWRQEL